MSPAVLGREVPLTSHFNTVVPTCRTPRPIRYPRPRRCADWLGVDMVKAICDVTWCGRPRVARGYCDLHYREWRREGVAGKPRVVAQGASCGFTGCGRRIRSAGLCAGHYLQQHRGEELRPLREYISTTELDDQGRKQCSGCREWKPADQYHAHPRVKGGRQSRCMRCLRDNRLRATYGITLAQYEAMVEEQGGGCAICGGTNGSGRALHVDHDHGCCAGTKSCGACVRALLCDPCNRSIGLMREDAQRLEKAAAYLRRYDRVRQ